MSDHTLLKTTWNISHIWIQPYSINRSQLIILKLTLIRLILLNQLQAPAANPDQSLHANQVHPATGPAQLPFSQIVANGQEELGQSLGQRHLLTLVGHLLISPDHKQVAAKDHPANRPRALQIPHERSAGRERRGLCQQREQEHKRRRGWPLQYRQWPGQELQWNLARIWLYLGFSSSGLNGENYISC